MKLIATFFFTFSSLSCFAGVLHLEEAHKKNHKLGAQIQFLAPSAQNAFIGLLTIPAKGKVPKHKDPSEEIIHVLSGRGTIWIDGKKQSVKSGSTIYMKAGAEVSFENGDQEMRALQVFAPSGPEKKYNSWTDAKLK